MEKRNIQVTYHYGSSNTQISNLFFEMVGTDEEVKIFNDFLINEVKVPSMNCVLESNYSEGHGTPSSLKININEDSKIILVVEKAIREKLDGLSKNSKKI